MLRVLRQSPENPVIWQRALLTHEVEEVLGPLAATGNGAGTVDQSVLATERVRQRYAAITSGAAAQGEPGTVPDVRVGTRLVPIGDGHLGCVASAAAEMMERGTGVALSVEITRKRGLGDEYQYCSLAALQHTNICSALVKLAMRKMACLTS
ncbi:hypothetical protein Vretifemale_4509 [Volvox reticuliferus]|uniref:Uncharacterized protein n=1 Tax=Volvox reticuliferus TaxID=1737510 RepID=A0A8J4FJC9_9CHLO|nr:hypothetical protein Vretifemale_4509 [Volvox reticuliferus]